MSIDYQRFQFPAVDARQAALYYAAYRYETELISLRPRYSLTRDIKNAILPHPANLRLPTYRTGGLVSSTPRTAKPRARGMDGFSDAEFVAGVLRGFRWWTLNVPPLDLNPFWEAGDGALWQPDLLRGMKGFWQPGVNKAECLPPSEMYEKHEFGQIPDPECACGFWAYWKIQHHDISDSRTLPVVGVVEGTGQTLIGPAGFRAQQAKIVALYLPFQIEPDVTVPPEPSGRDFLDQGQRGRWWDHPQFTGRVINCTGSGADYGNPGPAPGWSEVRPEDYTRAAPEPPASPPPPTDDEIAEARDRAEAWKAVIADKLGQLYPDAEVCETLKYMLARYPVTSEYTAP